MLKSFLILAAATAISAPAAAGTADLRTLQFVNEAVNKHPANAPNAKWSRPEYGGGDTAAQGFIWDCEDYAREKRDRLSRRGVRGQEIRVFTSDGQAHAILQVMLNDQPYILDNLHREVLTIEKAIAIYPGAWRYRGN